MASTKEVEIERIKFNEWVQKYEVVENISAEKFDISKHNPFCVWTEYNYFDSDATGIREGYLEFVDDITQIDNLAPIGYFVSRKPWNVNDVSEVPLASILLDCDSCNVEGYSDGFVDGEECSSCNGFRGDWIEFEI